MVCTVLQLRSSVASCGHPTFTVHLFCFFLVTIGSALNGGPIGCVEGRTNRRIKGFKATVESPQCSSYPIACKKGRHLKMFIIFSRHPHLRFQFLFEYLKKLYNPAIQCFIWVTELSAVRTESNFKLHMKRTNLSELCS